MGKSQKNQRAKIRRHNPVRVPDSHLPKGLQVASATSARKEDVLPIIRKLESVEAEERTWACSAVSNLIQNDASTRRLLQGKNIVGALITRLSDNVDEVVVEATGALRNLCIDAGYDICAEMYNKNILAPLQAFIPKISNALHHLLTSPNLTPSPNPKSALSSPDNTATSTRLVYDLAENVITLLWCLSETSNRALNAVNALHLVPFLMAFLENRGKLPERTVVAAAQCLYVLTDDNPPAIDELRANSTYISCLLSIACGDVSSVPFIPPIQATTNAEVGSEEKEKEEKDLNEERAISLRLLSAGTLRNVQPIPAPSAASTIDVDRNVVLPLVLPLLASVSLELESNRVMELVGKIDDGRGESGEKMKEKEKEKERAKSDHKSPEKRELERIEVRLRNVLLGLEVLTGVCATLPDPDPVPEMDEEEEAEEVEEVVDGIIEEEMNDEVGEKEDVDVEMDSLSPSPSPPFHPVPELQKQANGSTSAPSSSPSQQPLLPTILPSLLPLIQPTPLSFPPLPPPPTSSASPTPALTHPPTTSALGAIHVSALECLNNACLALSLSLGDSEDSSSVRARNRPDVDDGRRLWDATWRALAAVGLEGGRGLERRREMWEVAVGVLWGVGGIWKGLIMPEKEQVNLLMQLCDASADSQVQVKCIGALECLAHYPGSIEANRIISSYFLSLLTRSPPLGPEVVFQAVSSLIDIYSDETTPYDVNFRSQGYLTSLTRAVDVVRRAVRSVDRKKGGGRALRERGEETLENLRDFIRYRKELGV